MGKNDASQAKRIEELNQLIIDFVQAHLSEGHKNDCLLSVIELDSHPDAPLQEGELNLWAAAIIQHSRKALGNSSQNGIPFASDKVIASHFGVKQLAMREKAEHLDRLLVQIDDEDDDELDFPFDDWDEDWDAESIYTDEYQPQAGEFIDKGRNLGGLYVNLDTALFLGTTEQAFIQNAQESIKREPEYLLPYIDLADTYDAIDQGLDEKLINDAYQIAMRLITAESGEWPQLIESTRSTNRHILLTLLKQAEWQWRHNNLDQAKELLLKLLEVNPLDNINTRYFLAAILEGISHEEWKELMDDEKLSEAEMLAIMVDGAPSPEAKWFETVEPKHPEVFGPWRERRAQRLAELNLEDDFDGVE